MLEALRFIARRPFTVWGTWVVFAFALAVALGSESEGVLMTITGGVLILVFGCHLAFNRPR